MGRKNKFGRFKVVVLNPSFVPKKMDVVIGTRYMDLKFEIEPFESNVEAPQQGVDKEGDDNGNDDMNEDFDDKQDHSKKQGQGNIASNPGSQHTSKKGKEMLDEEDFDADQDDLLDEEWEVMEHGDGSHEVVRLTGPELPLHVVVHTSVQAVHATVEVTLPSAVRSEAPAAPDSCLAPVAAASSTPRAVSCTDLAAPNAAARTARNAASAPAMQAVGSAAPAASSAAPAASRSAVDLAHSAAAALCDAINAAALCDAPRIPTTARGIDTNSSGAIAEPNNVAVNLATEKAHNTTAQEDRFTSDHTAQVHAATSVCLGPMLEKAIKELANKAKKQSEQAGQVSQAVTAFSSPLRKSERRRLSVDEDSASCETGGQTEH